MNGAVFLGVEVDPARIEKRLKAVTATKSHGRSMKRSS